MTTITNFNTENRTVFFDNGLCMDLEIDQVYQNEGGELYVVPVFDGKQVVDLARFYHRTDSKEVRRVENLLRDEEYDRAVRKVTALTFIDCRSFGCNTGYLALVDLRDVYQNSFAFYRLDDTGILNSLPWDKRLLKRVKVEPTRRTAIKRRAFKHVFDAPIKHRCERKEIAEVEDLCNQFTRHLQIREVAPVMECEIMDYENCVEEPERTIGCVSFLPTWIEEKYIRGKKLEEYSASQKRRWRRRTRARLTKVADVLNSKLTPSNIGEGEKFVVESQGEGELEVNTPGTTEEVGDEVKEIETENVTIVENRETTEADPLEVNKKMVSMGVKPAVYRNLTDRFNNLGTFNWSTVHTKGEIIHTYDLPLFVHDALCSNPATLPHEQYMYIQPEMTLRFQLNSTKFHQGKLVIGYRYYHRYSVGVANVVHAAQVVQMDYASLNAAGSNIVQLCIPFQSHLDMLPIRDTNIGSSNYYVTVFVAVLSPLATGPDNQQTVTVTTQLSLQCKGEPTKFYGIRARQAVESQMMGELVKESIPVVESLIQGLGSKFKSSNQDKPVLARDSGTLIRNPIVSLSYGNGATNSKIMRLTPNTLTPFHPCNTPKGDNLSTNDLTKKWGYIGSFNISVGDLPQTVLHSIIVSPVVSYSVADNEHLPTPCAGVANLFSYWSGSIEYKFEVVKAAMHTLRLRFSVNPTDTVNGCKSIALMSTVFDFQEKSEVAIRVPFMAPSKMVPTYFGDNAVGVGNLQVSLETALASMASLSGTIEVLVYQRGGPDLVLSVPRPNRYLSSIAVPQTTLEFEYPGEWSQYFVYVVLNTTSPNNRYGRLHSPDTIDLTRYPNCIILVAPLEAPNFVVSGFGDFPVGQTRLLTQSEPTFATLRADGALVGGSAVASSKASYHVGNTQVEFAPLRRFYLQAEGVQRFVVELAPPPTKAVAVESQGLSERQAVDNTQGEGITSKDMSEVVLGENFPLVTSLRRYQNIHSVLLNGFSPNLPVARLIFDVNFGTPFMREGDELDNVSFIHDAFRFAKGSINYVFNALSTTDSNISVYVRHVPAGLSDVFHTTSNWEYMPWDQIPNSIFAHEIVFSQNTSVPITVPFYNYTNFLVNHYSPIGLGTSDSAAYSSGYIETYVINSNSNPVKFSIERSLGDDTDMFVFQGWPLCDNSFSVMDWNSENVQEQRRRGLPPKVGKADRLIKHRQSNINGQDFQSELTSPASAFLKEQMKCSGGFGLICTEIYNNMYVESQGLTEILDNIKEKAKSYSSTVLTFFTDMLLDLAGKGVMWSIDVFSNIMKTVIGALSFAKLYSIYNLIKMAMTAGTPLWTRFTAAFLILLDIGLVHDTAIKTAIVLCCELLYALSPKSVNAVFSQGWEDMRDNFDNVVEAQKIKSDPHTLARNLLSLVLAGIAAFCGFKNSPTSIAGVGSFIKTFVSCGNQFNNFFKSIGSVVIDFILECMGKEDEKLSAAMQLKAVSADMDSWVDECLYLIEPSRHNEVMSNRMLRERVSKCYTAASILSKSIMKHEDAKFRSTFMHYLRAITEVYRETGTVPNSVQANVCPLVVWLNGAPGVGKSQFAAHLAIKLCTALNIPFEGDPCFTRISGRKYWDGYTGQPVVIFDDALQVSSSEANSQFFQDWFSLISNAPFTAEFSAMNEKKKYVFPSIVLVCSNNAFPQVQVSSKNAFYRRRDILVEVGISESLKKKCKGIVDLNHPEVNIEPGTWDHLQFAFYPSPRVEKNADTLTNWVDYNFAIKVMVDKLVPLFHSRCMAAKKIVETSGELSAEVLAANRDILLEKFNIGSTAKMLSEKLGIGDFTPLASFADVVRGATTSMGVNSQMEETGEVSPHKPFDLPFTKESLSCGDNWFRKHGKGIEDRRKKTYLENVNLPFCTCMWQHKFESEFVQQGKGVMAHTIAIESLKILGDANYCYKHKKWNIRGMRGFLKDSEGFADVGITTYSINLEFCPLSSKCSKCDALFNLISDEATCKAAQNYMREKVDRASMERLLGTMFPLRGYAPSRCHENKEEDCPSCHLLSYKTWISKLDDFWQYVKDNKIMIALGVGCFLVSLAGLYGGYKMLTSDDWSDKLVSTMKKDTLYQPASGTFCEKVGISTEEFLDKSIKFGFDLDKTRDWFLANTEKGKAWAALVAAGSVGVSQIMSSGDVKTTRVAGKTIRVPQSLQAQGTEDDLYRRIYRNTVKLVVETSNTVYVGMAVGLVDRTILSPHHYFLRGDAIEKLSIQLSGQHEEGGIITLNRGDFKVSKISSSDLCTVTILNRRIPQFKNLVNQIVDSKIVNNISTKGILHEVDASSGKIEVVRSNLDIKQVDMPIYYQDWVPKLGYAPEYSLIGFEYARSKKGLCGSLLVDSRSKKIIGMHTCGAEKGYASALIADIFYPLASVLRDVQEPDLLPGPGKIRCEGEFVPLGVLESNKTVSLSTNTSIVPSECKGVLCDEVRVPVNIVSQGDKFPGEKKLVVALQKGFKPSSPFELSKIKTAKESLCERICSRAKPIVSVRSGRSIEDAFNGLNGVPFFESMKLNTSPGWPLNVKFKGSKKSTFTQIQYDGSERKVVGLHPALVEIYESCHKMRSEGVKPFDPYCNFTKDERLKPGKNPRLINGSSFATTIEFRRYTMDFVAALQSNNFDCGVAIGMNIHGHDWTRLAHKLLAKGDKICCGDYSGFGPGLDPELVLCAGEIMEEWYKQNAKDWCEEHARIRRLLFEELAFSKEISVDSVIETLCGSPSGNPMTVVVNSIVNLLYLLLVWLKRFDGTDLGTPSAFWESVVPIVYGDDLILSVKPELIEFFNNEVISEVLKSQGIVYTDADKTGVIRKYTNIFEATFLKCYFRKHDKRGESFWLAALEKPMIEDMCNWVRKPYNDLSSVSIQNCREAARLAYAWGEKYHDEVKEKLVIFWRSKGFDLQLESWDYIDALFFGDLQNFTQLNVGGSIGLSNWAKEKENFLSPSAGSSGKPNARPDGDETLLEELISTSPFW